MSLVFWPEAQCQGEGWGSFMVGEGGAGSRCALIGGGLRGAPMMARGAYLVINQVLAVLCSLFGRLLFGLLDQLLETVV